jgi:predicted nucleic acid-binding protein
VPLYLVDSSIWVGARRKQAGYLSALLAERIAADEAATCIPIALEVLTGPRNADQLERDWSAVWQHLRWLAVSERVMERSLEILRALASTTEGAHRRRPIDYVVAACAEAAGAEVVLWHWDRDLAVICDFTGIAHEPEHERARRRGAGAEPGRS